MARSHLRRLQHRGGLWGRWGRRQRHILHDPTSRSRQKRQRTAEQRQRLISDASAGHGESALRGMLRCAKRTLAVAVAARQPAQGQKVPRRLVAEAEERQQAQAPLPTTPQSPPNSQRMHLPPHLRSGLWRLGRSCSGGDADFRELALPALRLARQLRGVTAPHRAQHHAPRVAPRARSRPGLPPETPPAASGERCPRPLRRSRAHPRLGDHVRHHLGVQRGHNSLRVRHAKRRAATPKSAQRVLCGAATQETGCS
jgi:hypothetical protein